MIAHKLESNEINQPKTLFADCVSLSLWVNVSLCVNQCVCLCVFVPVSLWVCVCESVCQIVYVFLFLCLCESLSLCVCIYESVCLVVHVFLFLCLCESLSLCVSVWLKMLVRLQSRKIWFIHVQTGLYISVQFNYTIILQRLARCKSSFPSFSSVQCWLYKTITTLKTH